jgi:hypothetical protein
MPKIRFCPQCKNNFSNYSYVTEQKDNKPVNYLVYTCQACLYNERMDTITAASEGVLFSKNNLNKLPDREIHPDMCLDPTLPHTTQVECPNKECQTNASGSSKEKRNVVFFHYNTEMKLAFICCVCRSSWV